MDQLLRHSSVQAPVASAIAGPEGRYRPDIDGLRAVAVLAVILNHIDHRLLPGGYLGVDVFFVISGYVITLSMARHGAASLRSLLGGFYARRCRRLIPALASCALATGLLAWLLDPAPGATLATGMAALLGLSNIALLVQAQDYFTPSSQLNMFTQTWSLGVEEQFYLSFPLLVWWSRLGRGEDGAQRLMRLCLALSAVSIVLLFALPGARGGAAYFLVLGRFWELGAGCVAALLAMARPGLAVRLARPGLGWAGLALLATALAVPLRPTVLASLLIVPPTLMLILAESGNRGSAAGAGMVSATRLLSWRPCVAIGRMSYSLYLWHWPVVSASLLVLGRFSGQLPAQLAVILALGLLGYAGIERPARAWLNTRPATWSFAVAALAVLGVGGALLALASYPNPTPLAVRRFLVVPPAVLPFPGTGGDPVRDCSVAAVAGRPLLPTTLDRCTAPPTRPGAPTVWAMGDSHAGHLLGMLAALRRQEGIGVHMVETPGQSFPGLPGAAMPERNAMFQAILPRLRPGDVLLLGRLFLSRDDRPTALPEIAPWIAEVEQLALRMRPLGVRVVVVGPMPMFRFSSIYGCGLLGGGATDCDVGREGLARVIGPILQALRAAADRQPNLAVFDAFALLCPPTAAACSPVRDMVPQFRDRDHLNTAGAAGLAEAFRPFIAGVERPGGP